MITIKEREQNAKNMNELLDHLIKLIESNDERYSFEWASGGESITMEIFDKFKEIGYAVKIEPIKYDEDGNAINLEKRNARIWKSQKKYTLLRC